MRRHAVRIPLGEGRERHRVVLEDDPSDRGSPHSRAQLHMLLQTLANTPSLLLCGGILAENIHVRHAGGGWRVEMEAEIDAPAISGG